MKEKRKKLLFFSYIEAENDWTSRADYSRRNCLVCSTIEGEIDGYTRTGTVKTGTAFQASRISKSKGVDLCDHSETDHYRSNIVLRPLVASCHGVAQPWQGSLCGSIR
jgi:hypothetical protein